MAKSQEISKFEESVINILDSSKSVYQFPIFNNPLAFNIGSQMNLFYGESKWAITIEIIEYNNRDECLSSVLYCYGFIDRTSLQEEFIKYDYVTTDEELDSIRLGDSFETFELISKDSDSLIVRGKKHQIEQDITKYRNLGIEIRSDENPENHIDFVSAFRYLMHNNRDSFFSCKKDLEAILNFKIERRLKIDNWFHEDTLPSKVSTYRDMLEFFTNKDYKFVCDKSNTHWSNWPESGIEP